MRLWICLTLAWVSASCASNQDRFSNSLEVESTDGIGTVVEAQAQQGLSAGTRDSHSLEWFSCTRNVKAPYILMLNSQGKPFKADACKNGLVQAFLQQNFNVVAVNRPGSGQSEGKETLGDDMSLASLQALVKAHQATGKVMEGVWGFEEASVVAFRLAKNSTFQFLIVGNGLYDWEATLQHNKDAGFINQLKQLQAGQDGKFAELRSIAWDFSGLPKTIYLYHTQDDPRYPDAQAEAFRSVLSANQYGVKLIELKDEKATLTPALHQSVLMQIGELQSPSAD